MPEFDDSTSARQEDLNAAHHDVSEEEFQRKEKEIFQVFDEVATKLRRAGIPRQEIAYLDTVKNRFFGSSVVRCVYDKGWLLKGCGERCNGRVMLRDGYVMKAHTCDMSGPYLPGDIKVLQEDVGREIPTGFANKEQVMQAVEQLLRQK